MSAGLTDAEREGGWHVTQAFYTGLVFSEPAVARIKAEAVAAARANERERLGAAANVALSVWSNTCNAFCLEEDRTHVPECLLAADLYERLRAGLAQPAATKAADQ